jgi:hypothetical protein
MANVATTSFSHTYAGRELLTEIFYTPQEDVPAIESLYRVISTVDKTNIYVPATLSKILRKYTGCGFTAAGGTFAISDKVISTEKIKANVEECVEAFADTIFYEAVKKGVEIDDISNTVVDDMIKRQFVKGMASDIHRIYWFADANDADSDWNQFDGLISLFVDASATIGTSCFVDADSTAFETGDALATDGAAGLMKQLWEAQNASLRTMQNKQFYVTYTVYDNLMDTYEDLNSSAGLLRLVNGTNQLTYRGVPVVPVPEWDANLADSTNPHYTGSGLSIGSNLIVLTTPDNLIIGTDVSSPSSEFKIRYADNDEETMKITSKFKLGAQFVHESLVCLAY